MSTSRRLYASITLLRLSKHAGSVVCHGIFETMLGLVHDTLSVITTRQERKCSRTTYPIWPLPTFPVNPTVRSDLAHRSHSIVTANLALMLRIARDDHVTLRTYWLLATESFGPMSFCARLRVIACPAPPAKGHTAFNKRRRYSNHLSDSAAGQSAAKGRTEL